MLFLTMRVAHVVLAAAWFGAAVMTTLYLGPATSDAGAAGGQVMGALVRRGLMKFLASIGGLTVVSGVYLFWRFTGGFDPALSASRGGMAYSIGALTGVIALALSGSVVGASAKKLAVLGPQVAGMPEGAERIALVSRMNELQSRMSTFGYVVVVLLFISLATMALGHYV